MPMLTCGQKLFEKWNWKYATAITPDKMNATGRVKRPRTSSPPPIISSNPAIHASDITGTVPPFGGTPTGKASTFMVPNTMKTAAATMRRMLLICGAQEIHFAAMLGVPFMIPSSFSDRLESLERSGTAAADEHLPIVPHTE